MKKIISLVLLLSVAVTSLVLITSCSSSNSYAQYITDEEREAHIEELIGDNLVVAENVKTVTWNTDESGQQVSTVEETWVVCDEYKNKAVGATVSNADGVKRGIETMTLMYQNSKYALYMDITDKNTGDIAIEDKTTGHIYHSNPTISSSTYSNVAAAGDDADKEAVLNPIISPIAVEAYDISNKRYEFNYRDNCLSARRIQIVKTSDNSFRIIYTIGNDPDADLVPPVLTVATWDWVCAQLEKVEGGSGMIADLKQCYKLVSPDKITLEDKERFIDDYPKIEMWEMYISRQLNTRQKKLVKQAMKAAGFTVEMLKKEMDTVEYCGPARAVMYTIPVDITLTDDGLDVTVDSTLILAPQKQKLYKIYLYRALGSYAPIDVGGKITGVKYTVDAVQYMIIPDGSGAIMPAKGNLTTDVFTARVYGLDDVFQLEQVTTNTEQVVSPILVFDRSRLGGMMAILDSGGVQAFATARPANSTNNPAASINYDLVYAERAYRTYTGGQGSSTTIGSSDTSSAGVVLSKETAVAVFKVSYLFTAGDLTYSDYAQLYREYLIKNGKMPSTLKTDSTVPFYADILGAINKKESVAGIPTDHLKALTTYNEVNEIADALLEKGVENVNFRYLYWANDGYYNTIADGVKLIGALGSTSELKSLVSYLQSKNIGFYPDVNFLYIYKDKLFDSMNYTQDAARSLDMTVAKCDYRDLSTGYNWTGFDYTATVVSADKIPAMASGFKSALERVITNKQISLGLIGSVVDSNYKIGRIVNRTQALNYHIDAIQTFDGYDMMFETGNDYTWKYASHILNLPVGSSEYMSTTESIPFIQMVIHGYIDYAGSPLNEDADYDTALLEILETGSGIYFKWMAEDNSVFDNTDMLGYYSLNYKSTIDKAAELYKTVSSLMNKVANKPITNHEAVKAYYVYKGERTYYTEGDENYVEGGSNIAYTRVPADNVYATTYGGTVKFYVNYNSFDVELEDETTVIPAQGYLEVKVG